MSSSSTSVTSSSQPLSNLPLVPLPSHAQPLSEALPGIPNELFRNSLSFLDARNLARLCCVNRTWRTLIDQDDSLWDEIAIDENISKPFYWAFRDVELLIGECSENERLVIYISTTDSSKIPATKKQIFQMCIEPRIIRAYPRDSTESCIQGLIARIQREVDRAADGYRYNWTTNSSALEYNIFVSFSRAQGVVSPREMGNYPEIRNLFFLPDVFPRTRDLSSHALELLAKQNDKRREYNCSHGTRLKGTRLYSMYISWVIVAPPTAEGVKLKRLLKAAFTAMTPNTEHTRQVLDQGVVILEEQEQEIERARLQLQNVRRARQSLCSTRTKTYIVALLVLMVAFSVSRMRFTWEG